MITIRYKKMKSGKFSIYLDIYAKDASGKGKRSYEFLNIHVTKDYSKLKRVISGDQELVSLANNIKLKREVEIAQSANGYIPKKQKHENIGFITYLNQYAEVNNDETAKKLSSNIIKYSGSINLTFNDISFNWLENFKRYATKNLKQNSVRNYLWKLKQVLKHAVKSGVIESHNFNGIDIPARADTNMTTLTLEEIQQLSETPANFNIQIKQAFLFACFQGLRRKEVYNLTWSDILEDEIRVGESKVKGKTRGVPLTEPGKKILSEVDRAVHSNKIFWKLPVYQTTGKHLRIWGLKAGLKKHIHFHASRHSFATVSLTYGIDVYTMQNFLGHSKMEMTQHYAKLVDEKKKKEAAKFPSLKIQNS